VSPQGPKKDLYLKLGELVLEQVPTYRYLGVEMDEKLKFSEQVSKATLKTKRGIGMLNRTIRKWATSDVLKTAISSIALPIMLYGIETWFPPDLGKQKQVAKVQKYAARLVTNNFLHSTSYEDLLQQVGWQKIHYLVATRRLLTVKKYISGERHISKEVFKLKCPSTDRTSARIREATASHDIQLEIRKVKNVKEGKMAAAQTRKLWNALDKEAVTCSARKLEELLQQTNLLEKLTEKGALDNLTGV
jgi:hypothetical protein